MSISKLISRIVGQCTFDGSDNDIVTQLSCDPLLHMACLIAGLIHDLLHPGVPNTTLIKEKVPIAVKYNGRCVAERNSLDKAWELLMEDRFLDFRLALCPTKNEVLRFRKFLVHLVLATDIMDAGLRELYVSRWTQVFEGGDKIIPAPSTQSTLVLQHLIQASDVSHTMQHWEIYLKWNECLFAEMCEAFESGRQSWNPVESWYEGEIKFFDNYIIPLAEKLRTCGVFGACSDEYLNYARQNRAEWERRGPGIVAEMLHRMQTDAILSPPPSPVKRLLFKPPFSEDRGSLTELMKSFVSLDADFDGGLDMQLDEDFDGGLAMQLDADYDGGFGIEI
jgi:3'5'-cyclic nucleotide phosphodiesterase